MDHRGREKEDDTEIRARKASGGRPDQRCSQRDPSTLAAPPELQFLVHPSLINRMPSWLEGSCGDCGCPSGKGLATTAQRTWRQSRKWVGSAKATKVRGRALQGPQQGQPNALVLPSSTSTTQMRSARGRRARIARGDWTVGRADPHLDRYRECGGLDFRSRAMPRICVTAGAS